MQSSTFIALIFIFIKGYNSICIAQNNIPLCGNSQLNNTEIAKFEESVNWDNFAPSSTFPVRVPVYVFNTAVRTSRDRYEYMLGNFYFILEQVNRNHHDFIFELKEVVDLEELDVLDETRAREIGRLYPRGGKSVLRFVIGAEIGKAGYSSFPWYTAERDFITMNEKALTIKEHVTHEIGHWLGLFHIWGNSNESTGTECNIGDFGDGVFDTNQQKYAGRRACGTEEDSCGLGNFDDITNFMGYDYCRSTFTAGQFERMRKSWDTYRNVEKN